MQHSSTQLETDVCVPTQSATASQNLLTCLQPLVSQFTQSQKIYTLEYWPKVTKREETINHVSFRGQKKEIEVKKGKLQFLNS